MEMGKLPLNSMDSRGKAEIDGSNLYRDSRKNDGVLTDVKRVSNPPAECCMVTNWSDWSLTKHPELNTLEQRRKKVEQSERVFLVTFRQRILKVQCGVAIRCGIIIGRYVDISRR